MAIKIGVISLGCAKNMVDTEVMLGILANEGYEFVQQLDQADIALINTCAFTNDAKEESINTILEAEQQKRFGSLKGIIVVGCLPQRFKEQLRKLVPRVDAYLGTAAYKDISDAIKKVAAGERYSAYADRTLTEEFEKRIITTPKPTAYVKIAEGCDNKCGYCVIPDVRGPYQSRKIEDILSEIKHFADQGYSEIILVSQDSTRYGTDIYGEPRLAELMDRAAQIKGVHWLRALYFYPDGISDELLDVFVKHDNITKYIDMPIQHMDNTILQKMGRRNTYESNLEAVRRIREKSPDFVIRTTVIVGFPGEDRKKSAMLNQGLKEAQFDHLGVFSYSQEEGTVAAEMEDQVDESEKEFRRDATLNLQSPISLARNKLRVGMIVDVLIEGKDEQTGYYYGRSYAHIPEVDGKVLIKAERQLNPGAYYQVEITEARTYDCVAELTSEEETDI